MIGMRFVMAALFACGCVDLSEPAGWVAADDYINSGVACSQSSSPKNCEITRTNWAKTYAGALAGSYRDQRSVSLCLSTGCDQAIRKDPVLGCAWRIVIAKSGHPQADAGDTADARYYCGPKMLDDAGRKAAELQSETLLATLAKTN